MIDSDIARLLAAAEGVAAGEDLTSDLLAEEGVPVALRLLLACAALAAADQPVTKLSMTTSAPAARSAAYRDHAELMDRLKASLPGLVSAQLATTRREHSVADLAAQLERANCTIAEERAKCEALEVELVQVANYARELHWQLRPEYEAQLREKAEKVRPLRAVSDEGAT